MSEIESKKAKVFDLFVKIAAKNSELQQLQKQSDALQTEIKKLEASEPSDGK